ncbi:hypothetical protein BO94DRAFT_550103 [Aspergillus sclerotioniger CBS 115572]|uniref:Uncharacterized protein n=1 Tax=Aspergillus sclerotioniger CBS 115572 TaxID=1450535 RepID=A0A317VH83_9EURO|nr:hypothetical protein BO94DRAFT_550103 [Aspergillus sclerotioniger CBS 115572]PWY72527.1 hypothetical protein BO94DRAFT_550103 [Aspergillus sclerotioniger CBS 115572]
MTQTHSKRLRQEEDIGKLVPSRMPSSGQWVESAARMFDQLEHSPTQESDKGRMKANPISVRPLVAFCVWQTTINEIPNGRDIARVVYACVIHFLMSYFSTLHPCKGRNRQQAHQAHEQASTDPRFKPVHQ